MRYFFLNITLILAIIGVLSCNKKNSDSTETGNFNSVKVISQNLRAANTRKALYEFGQRGMSPTSNGRGQATLNSFDYTNFEINQADFQNFFHDIIEPNITNVADVGVNPLDIVIYSSVENSTGNISDVLGFNVLYGRENNSFYEHRFYHKVNNSFVLVPTLTVETSTIQLRDIAAVALEFKKSFNNIYCTHLSIFNENYTGQVAADTMDNGRIAKALAELNYPIVNDVNKVLACRPEQCPAGNKECVKNPRGHLCDQVKPWICQQRAIEVLNQTSASVKDQREAFAYGFRDNFMTGKAIGNKYMEYYARLGDLNRSYKIINLYNASYFLDFLLQTHQVASTLSSGNDTDIVISNLYFTNAMEVIALYKSKTQNSDYHAILNDIESDLNFFKGKSRAEVISALQ
ncbi:MAG: hypothetical protein EAZ47_09125 [Bacteroidetes bacterium]|nr:MAG: hypothetical protein EAY72_11660 [Bacteroidota bacterium]TAF92052.1 MAG: hypothetical protein EAZ47_09125 [Bacteroidota bacterium]